MSATRFILHLKIDGRYVTLEKFIEKQYSIRPSPNADQESTCVEPGYVRIIESNDITVLILTQLIITCVESINGRRGPFERARFTTMLVVSRDISLSRCYL